MTTVFNIDDSITLRHKIALAQVESREARQNIRKYAVRLLAITDKRGQAFNETTFVDVMSGIKHELTDPQFNLALDIYLAASKDYELWLLNKEESLEKAATGEATNYGASY